VRKLNHVEQVLLVRKVRVPSQVFSRSRHERLSLLLTAKAYLLSSGKKEGGGPNLTQICKLGYPLSTCFPTNKQASGCRNYISTLHISTLQIIKRRSMQEVR